MGISLERVLGEKKTGNNRHKRIEKASLLCADSPV